MVTVIHNDINEIYNNINRWIIIGINRDALYLSINQWVSEDPYNRDYSIWVVRNEQYEKLNSAKYKPIKPLNKW